jgi:hypothetical protein
MQLMGPPPHEAKDEILRIRVVRGTRFVLYEVAEVACY